MTGTPADVVVVGGGAIGLAASWRLAQAGLRTTVVDPAPGRGASWAAAGMLAPVTEAHFGEEALGALNLAAAARWPGFASELERAAGAPVGFEAAGTLLVAADGDDRRVLERLHAYMVELGLEAEWCTPRQARRREPNLAPAVAGALWAPGDGRVHNRQLVAGLVTAARAAGVTVTETPVAAVRTEGGRARGVTLADGADLDAPAVVVAAGAGSAALAGIPPGALPTRPVKGQILRLGPGRAGPLLSATVRGVVGGRSVYLVPRPGGQMVVGATVEEQGADTTVTAGAVYELLRDARRVLPGVAELVLEEASAGLRPGSPDNAPMLGPVPGLDGVVAATGHFRNGVLLTPLTAEAVAAWVTGASPPAEVAPFSPARFAGAPRAARPGRDGTIGR